MPLPRVLRALLCAGLMAVLFVLTQSADAADAITSKPSSLNAKHLVFTPASLSFGNVVVGQQKVQTITITNSGASAITLLRLATQGKDFTLIGLDLPLTLAGGESFTFSGAFAPQAPGYSSGSISFLSDHADLSTPILRSEMNGTGVEPDGLHADRPTMEFGNVPVGSMASQVITLAADKEVTIVSANSSRPEFSVSGASFPLTVPAGSSRAFTVTFAPGSDSVASGTLSFTSASGTSLVAIKSLNGVGTISREHKVDLKWKASKSHGVIGYNVYRALASAGPYTKINTALDQNTVYTDTSVTNGKTYYYATTAVNSKKEESRFSNKRRAIIP